jgi:Flp pilus assembly pilin Flp
MALIDTLTAAAKRFRRLSCEAGASLVEYTLLVALVAVAAIVGMTFIGNTANDTLNDVGDKMVDAVAEDPVVEEG